MALISIKDQLLASGDRFNLQLTVSAIEAAHEAQESGLVIGQCKSLIESLSKSMLDTYGGDYKPNDNFQHLAKSAIKILELGKNCEEETKTKDAFTKLITSFINTVETAANGIGSLRNEYCPLAHGRGLNHKPLHMHYADYVLSQTYALTLFMLVMIEEKNNLEPPVDYKKNKDFNDSVDDTYGIVEIWGDEYLPSEIVFSLNPEKYKNNLFEFNSLSSENND